MGADVGDLGAVVVSDPHFEELLFTDLLIFSLNCLYKPRPSFLLRRTNALKEDMRKK